MLQKNTIPFLIELQKNNNKEWFTQNKEWYQLAFTDFKNFVDNLIPFLAKTDNLLNGVTAKECVYRIYRDVRFSKDKTPYKTHFGANIAPGGRKNKKAGFYLHIEPAGTSITGGGIYMPEAQVLKALRTEFYHVPEELLEILNNDEVKKYFGNLWDKDKLKTAPKGFPKDFKHIDLLKQKSYILIGELSKTDILNPDIYKQLIRMHKAMYPLNRLLNTIIDDAHL